MRLKLVLILISLPFLNGCTSCYDDGLCVQVLLLNNTVDTIYIDLDRAGYWKVPDGNAYTITCLSMDSILYLSSHRNMYPMKTLQEGCNVSDMRNSILSVRTSSGREYNKDLSGCTHGKCKVIRDTVRHTFEVNEEDLE